MTEERCFRLEERTFLGLEPQIVLTQLSEDFLNYLKMLFQRVRGDEDVIQVDEHRIAKVFLEDLLHRTFKTSRGIGQTEWKNVELPMSSKRRERCKLLCLRR